MPKRGKKPNLPAKLVEFSFEPMIVWDFDAGIIEWGPGCERLYGFTPDEAVGRIIHDLLGTIHPLPIEEFLVRLAAKGEWIGTLHHTAKDGRKVVVESRQQVVQIGKRRLVLETNRDITERKRVEEALNLSERRLRDALRVGRMGYLDWNLVTNEIEWSPETYRLFGHVPGDGFFPTIENTVAMVPPEDRAFVEERLEAVIRGTAAYDIVHRMVRPDAQVIYVHAHGEVIRDEHGRPVRMLGTVVDVTDQKRVEEELGAAKNRYRLALSGSPVVVWECDADLRFTFIDNPRPPITDPAQFIGKRDDEILPFEFVRELIEIKKRVLATGAGERREISLPAANKMFHFEMVFEPIYHSDGVITGLRGLAIDISERKRTEEALRIVSEELRQTLHTSAIGLTHCSRDLRYLSANPAYAQLVGLPLEQIVGRPIVEVIGKPAFEIIYPRIERVLAGETVEYEDEVAIGGINKFIRVASTPDRDVSGNVVGWVASVMDITERKRLEKEREEEGRRKDEFLATLGHELRNPMSALSVGLQLARMGRQSEPTLKQRLDMMDRQLTHLMHLVDDLLDIGRINAGKIKLQLEPVTLPEVLANSMEEVRAVIESRGHEVAIQIQPGRHRVRGDATRLIQVIANLIENAAKYTEPGGRIRVGLSREDGAEVVRVADTGIGIPADDLKHVFDIFSQVRTHQGTSSGGLGIGLAIVRTLAELHGGSVEAASDGIGQGSTFTMRLPALEEESTSTPKSEDLPPDGLKGSQPSRRVLIVDDNEELASSLADFLRLGGHQVWTANDGLKAIEIAKATDLDVVLMDLGMPGLGGIETAKRIRALPGRERLRMAALTGWGQESDRARTREAGFDWHLVKPSNPEFLSQFVAKLEPMRGDQSGSQRH